MLHFAGSFPNGSSRSKVPLKALVLYASLKMTKGILNLLQELVELSRNGSPYFSSFLLVMLLVVSLSARCD